MIGRMKILRGVPAPATVLPQVKMNSLDTVIASLRNDAGRSAIRYDLDPEHLSPVPGYKLSGFDRASARAILGSRASLSRLASDPAFNGAPVVSIDNTGGMSSDLTIFGPPTASFTLVSVASIAADLKGAPAIARLMSLMDGSTVRGYISMLASGAIASSGVASISVGDVPAANAAAVYVHTHDATTRVNRIYLNSDVLRASAVSSAPIEINEQMRVGIGGPAGTSASGGWRGKIARSLVFEGALTANQISVLVAALKQRYGIL